MSKFAENLTYLLDNQYISIQQILNITEHKSQSLISMWKSDERNIMPKDLIAIANFIGVTADDLYNNDIKNILNNKNNKEILFNKTKDLLSDSDWATIEFIMKKTIDEYEKNNNEGT